MTKIQISPTIRALLRLLRLIMSGMMWILSVFAAANYETTLYLLSQAGGQMKVLFNAVSIESYKATLNPNSQEWRNLEEIEKIRNFAVNEIGFKPSGSYQSVYQQNGQNNLWVITASEAYRLKPYEWDFPLVGKVSYKGYFNKHKALAEYNHLRSLGYDADIRTVTAWSTLGWFNDPLPGGTLKRDRGGFCDLIFHELFHATFYKKGAVDLNENLAVFVARKATIAYLRNDSVSLKTYLEKWQDEKTYSLFLDRKIAHLEKLYENINGNPQRQIIKLKAMIEIADSINYLPLHHKTKYTSKASEIVKLKNACFVDHKQYDALQDSIEEVFNKIYRGDLKKLVQDLKQDGIYY